MKIKKAFTLLEMLVVIGLITVILSMVFTSYTTSQKKARDAKRQGDLKAAQQIMEQCYSINSFQYPTITGGGTKTITIGTNCTADTSLTFTITDPLGTNIAVTSSTTAYSITSDIETGTNFTVEQQQ